MQVKTLMKKKYDLTIIMTARGGTIYTEFYLSEKIKRGSVSYKYDYN